MTHLNDQVPPSKCTCAGAPAAQTATNAPDRNTLEPLRPPRELRMWTFPHRRWLLHRLRIASCVPFAGMDDRASEVSRMLRSSNSNAPLLHGPTSVGWPGRRY